ncbi:hypothetical protein ELY21_05785 [Legionella sp. km535]|uniref:hypothetical protein n=1 Tax=Legionella sp. km535 TaxID=2498107 RepID=UPI000F8EBB20|nr:hypothetical protein [Legionella sp. km535]RUR19035.1 hypothetical protein ELY21_05785 [Legionella sp. km535]
MAASKFETGLTNSSEQLKNSDLKLPHLIFLEEHNQPVTKRILIRLLAKFQEIGYAAFFDELYKDTQLDSIIQGLEQQQGIYEIFVKSFTSTHPGINPDFDSLILAYLQNPVVLNFLISYPSRMEYLALAKELMKSSLIFKAIDFESTGDVKRDTIWAKSKDGMRYRDTLMAEAYISADAPVIGRMGLAHASGLRSVFSERNMSHTCKLFFIYSSGSIESFEKSIDEKISDDIIIIDARSFTDEAIEKIILDSIVPKPMHSTATAEQTNLFKEPNCNSKKDLKEPRHIEKIALRVSTFSKSVSYKENISVFYKITSKLIEKNTEINLGGYIGEHTYKLIKFYSDAGILSEELFCKIWDRGRMNHSLAEFSNDVVLTMSLLMNNYQLLSSENCLSILEFSGYLYLMIPVIEKLELMGKLSPDFFQHILNELSYKKTMEIKEIIENGNIDDLVAQSQLDSNGLAL